MGSELLSGSAGGSRLRGLRGGGGRRSGGHPTGCQHWGSDPHAERAFGLLIRCSLASERTRFGDWKPGVVQNQAYASAVVETVELSSTLGSTMYSRVIPRKYLNIE